MEINVSDQMLHVIHEALAWAVQSGVTLTSHDGHGYEVSTEDALDFITECRKERI